MFFMIPVDVVGDSPVTLLNLLMLYDNDTPAIILYIQIIVLNSWMLSFNSPVTMLN